MTIIPTQFYRHDVIRETEKAVCVRVDRASGIHMNQSGMRQSFRESQIWLPKSKIVWRETIYGEQLFVPDWLARKL